MQIFFRILHHSKAPLPKGGCLRSRLGDSFSSLLKSLLYPSTTFGGPPPFRQGRHFLFSTFFDIPWFRLVSRLGKKITYTQVIGKSLYSFLISVIPYYFNLKNLPLGNPPTDIFKVILKFFKIIIEYNGLMLIL